jgi:hypothetical protein
MSEHSLYEPQLPDLLEESDDVRHMVFYPTPEVPGRCITTAKMDVPTSADFFEATCYVPEGISPLLETAGVSIDYRSIMHNKVSTFRFAHPTSLAMKLQAVSEAHPDFKPPRFEACEDRYTFDVLASYMGRGVMPLATQGYSTVHDYEAHVPSLSVMAPELFTAICEQSQAIQPSERSEWMRQFDTLTQLGTFGCLLASTSKLSHREPMTNWLAEHTQFSHVDAIRLAYHSENYRREVITPVVNSLRA